MAQKTKSMQITIVDKQGTFSALFKKFPGNKKDYDFEGLSALRGLLSNEKARMMHTIKTKSPKSVYALAKMLGRDFKSVSDDIKLMEKFGFIDLIAEKTGKRERLRPRIILDSINIELKL
ncbi:hypothetical protein COU60_00370 [Candidatus Pacearchaeota archaeon CG10_big_fil_rev_8_21_14_0_10_34_76]|nr:MAG: hypothetical protein COU60_00370 [Candidatus Pacearchaeota archaeon CG10_big_fil_rev_8_21_14_0_10_34_76]